MNTKRTVSEGENHGSKTVVVFTKESADTDPITSIHENASILICSGTAYQTSIKTLIITKTHICSCQSKVVSVMEFSSGNWLSCHHNRDVLKLVQNKSHCVCLLLSCSLFSFRLWHLSRVQNRSKHTLRKTAMFFRLRLRAPFHMRSPI